MDVGGSFTIISRRMERATLSRSPRTRTVTALPGVGKAARPSANPASLCRSPAALALVVTNAIRRCPCRSRSVAAWRHIAR
jgi:hypothetical protein